MGRTPITVEVVVVDGLVQVDGRILSSPRFRELEGQQVRVTTRGAWQRVVYPPTGQPFIAWISPRSIFELHAERQAEVKQDARRRARPIGAVSPRAKR